VGPLREVEVRPRGPGLGPRGHILFIAKYGAFVITGLRFAPRYPSCAARYAPMRDAHPMKPRLTVDEHIEMGLALTSLRDELQRRYVQLANAYPQSGTPAIPAKKLEQAVDAIDAARTALENAMYQEHPQTADTSVYYPQDRIRVFPDHPQRV
jgi:hypothetical protein